MTNKKNKVNFGTLFTDKDGVIQKTSPPEAYELKSLTYEIERTIVG